MKSPPQPTLHVIPVGASLIRWLETERQPPAVCRALLPGDFPQATNPGQHVRVELVRARGNDRVLNLNTLLYRREAQSDAALSALSTMPCDACAEWNALNRFRVEFGAPARPNEAFLFVASDTDIGLRAATLVAARIARDCGKPLHYIDDPRADHLPMIEPGEIHLARIPSLDMALPVALPDPVATEAPEVVRGLSLGEIGRLIAHTARQVAVGDWTVVFHLTGGYKAMLPYFLVVADAVQTVLVEKAGRDPQTVRAYCLHEDSQRPVELPIRWLTLGNFADAQRMSELAGTGVDVCGGQLNDLVGLYLDPAGRKQHNRLNTSGMIMARTLWAIKNPT